MSGDTAGKYTTGDEDHDGWRITCAIVAGASQRGREWSEEQLWDALVLRPTPGGAWLRRLRSRGEGKARETLRRAMAGARRKVAANPAYSSRADAAGELAEIRDLLEACRWLGSTAGNNLKVVVAHLQEAERAGGRTYRLSRRQIVEHSGCSKATVKAVHERLADTWFVKIGIDNDAEGTTIWRLHTPEEIRTRLAALNNPKVCGLPTDRFDPPTAPPTRQVRGGSKTRTLAVVMVHDAMHHYGHGTTGGRILTTLDTTDGTSPQELAAVLGMHPETIGRHLARMTADELVTCTDGLYYPARHITEELLNRAAERRGTTGLCAKRAWRHAQERARRHAYLAYLASRPRRDHQSDPLVPLEAYDPETGELLPEQMHKWRGWDVTDPWRPVWRGTTAA